MLKLGFPTRDFNFRTSISQLFGVNYKLYSRFFNIPAGLHNAIDIRGGYGVGVTATHDGVISGIVDHKDPYSTKGNGVYIDGDSGQFTTIYWHLSEVIPTLRVGTRVSKGETIGKMGNSGFVRPKPTPENPHAGTHLHFGLKINDGRRNGYNGYIDPIPLMSEFGKCTLPVFFIRGMGRGSYGDYVSWLQTCLGLFGKEFGGKAGSDYEPIGYFGKRTERDLIEFQKKYGIKPSVGFCGVKTRSKLNERYSLYI